MRISVVAPMFNEEENLSSTLSKLTDEFREMDHDDYELIFVNDGSTDGTWDAARALATEHDRLTVVGYPVNQGRGKALRTGLEAATGDVVITVDFDLSYEASHIRRMVRALEENPDKDVVLVSAYMPGGQTIGVPRNRLAISKLGNLVFRYLYDPTYYTYTCVVRAYRRHVVDALVLESDDKEIHLEVITKTLALGFKIMEIPGTLRKRAAGTSKFRFKATSISHLVYLLFERPFVLFGFIGTVLVGLGVVSSGVIIYTRFADDPAFTQTVIGRIVSPNFVIILFLAGLQMMGLGFLGIQNNLLKKEVFKTQGMIKLLSDQSGRDA